MGATEIKKLHIANLTIYWSISIFNLLFIWKESNSKLKRLKYFIEEFDAKLIYNITQDIRLQTLMIYQDCK